MGASLVERDAVVPELLSVAQMARRLSVGVRSIWRWSDSGQLPRPVRVGRLVRWRLADVDRWVADGCPTVKPATVAPKAKAVRPASKPAKVARPVKVARRVAGR